MRKLILVICIAATISLGYAAEIPEQLQTLGFTKYTLIEYTKDEAGNEYFTFSDWLTENYGDTITFVVKEGEITKSFKKESRPKSEPQDI